MTAIIGPVGAGKSTLAKVIAGIVTPSRGSVRFNGHDVHDDYAALRCSIGMVPQEDVLHRVRARSVLCSPPPRIGCWPGDADIS